MAEVVLADMLAWMPSLQPVWGDRDDPTWLAQPISWAVAARSGTPMLPVLRGGEIVVVSPRTLRDQGIGLRQFAADLGRTGFTTMVLIGIDLGDALQDTPWLRLSSTKRPSEVEGEINRLLTEQRRLLYSRGTDLGRTLLSALSEGAEPAAIAALGAAAAAIPIELKEADAAHRSDQGFLAQEGGRLYLSVPIGEYQRLQVGPFQPADRAFANLSAERVGDAVVTALRRADLLRPRGPARAAALRSLLLGEAKPGAESALGLPATARYRVAIATARGAIREAGRLIGPGVVLHEAEDVSDASVAVFEWCAPNRPGQLRVERVERAIGTGEWLVVSDEVRLAGLATAMDQARFAASLLADGEIGGQVVVFDAVNRLGVFGLLYRLRSDPDLIRFVERTLAELRREDPRGVLRQTLRVYLDAGGVGVETAARLGIHRNTLSYRLRRIAALSGLDPADPKHWLTYGMALAGERVLKGEPTKSALEPLGAATDVERE